MMLTMAFHEVVVGLILEFENEIKTSRIEVGVSRLHREFLALVTTAEQLPSTCLNLTSCFLMVWRHLAGVPPRGEGGARCALPPR